MIVHNRKVLIAGAFGYIGNKVSECFSKMGYTVYRLTHKSLPSNRKKNVFSISDNNLNETVDKLRLVVDSDMVVINLAGVANKTTSFEDSKNIYDANYIYMFKILSLMTELGLKSYVSTGSYWQYDHLGKFRFVSPYIKSKNFASMTLQDLAGEKIKVCELVLYDTYCIDDTRGKLLNTLSKLSDKDIFPMTSGCQEICYVNVQDVSRAYYLCVNSFESITNQLAYVKIPLVSNDVRTLRLYIDDFLKHHPSPPQLNWGELKDNPESLRKIWLSNSAEHLMGWKAETNFSRYIPKFF